MRHQIVKFAFLLTLGSTVLFAGPFQNGGFESPVISSSPDFVTVPTGWAKFDGGSLGLFMQTYSSFGLPTTGGQGIQAFGFGGNGVTTGSLLQTFDTLNGAGYHVSFQYVIQQFTGLEDLVAEVFNGAVSAIGTNSAGCTVGSGGCLANPASPESSKQPVITTVPTGRWMQVSVTPTGGSEVPEPSTFTLMSLALAAFGWRRWKV